MFDRSPDVVDNPESSFKPLLRWDAFHFTSIAVNGYQFENQFAFLPALPFLISTFGTFLPVISLILAFLSAHSLYRLSLAHLRSPALARLTLLLSLLPTSPVTLWFAPHAEPFFTFLSYEGMLYCAHERWLLATICFTLASSFRSNGMFLVGFPIWGLVIQPFLNTRRVPYRNIPFVLFCTALVLAPFLAHNYSAYLAFCRETTASETAVTPPPWCSDTLPLIYSHVQSKYWDVGLFNYWTPQQLPNFLIAAPSLALLFSFSFYHLKHVLPPIIQSFTSLPSSSSSSPAPIVNKPQDPFLSPSLTPHVIHAAFLSCILLFASHTQIVLRLAASMPTTYWAASWLFMRATTSNPGRSQWKFSWSHLWVAWSVLWGGASVVLWYAFLPPA